MAKNSFVLVSGVFEESDCLWLRKVLLLFLIGARGSDESREVAYLLHKTSKRSTDMVDEMLGCVCQM